MAKFYAQHNQSAECYLIKAVSMDHACGKFERILWDSMVPWSSYEVYSHDRAIENGLNISKAVHITLKKGV